MSDTPVLGLGVDGVIVLDEPPATATIDSSVSAWGRWRRDIRVPADAPAVLARLSEHFEIVWVSGWGHNAHTALTPVLGLPARPWLFLPAQFNKAEAVARYAGDRPWALIEDAVAAGAQDDADDRIIRVDPRRGIAGIDPADVLARARSGVAAAA